MWEIVLGTERIKKCVGTSVKMILQLRLYRNMALEISGRGRRLSHPNLKKNLGRCSDSRSEKE